jgi:hypothetical protein
MPMTQGRVDAARARLDPGRPATPKYRSANGKGSRRETRPGEWFDDRHIEIGGPSSPSEDSPPEGKAEGRAVPASYDPLKVYSVTLGKPVVFSGRMLSPAKQYQMVGDACTEITANIVDAVEIGDIPADPDAQPSSAKTKSKAK